MKNDYLCDTGTSDFEIASNKMTKVEIADRRSSKAEELQVKKRSSGIRHRQRPSMNRLRVDPREPISHFHSRFRRRQFHWSRSCPGPRPPSVERFSQDTTSIASTREG